MKVGKNISVNAGENISHSAGKNIDQSAGTDIRQSASGDIRETADNKKEVIDKQYIRSASESTQYAESVTVFSTKEICF